MFGLFGCMCSMVTIAWGLEFFFEGMETNCIIWGIVWAIVASVFFFLQHCANEAEEK